MKFMGRKRKEPGVVKVRVSFSLPRYMVDYLRQQGVMSEYVQKLILADMQRKGKA